MVTCSAPGVEEEDARAFDAASRGTIPVTHYGGTVDGIPNTGERALSGTVYDVDRPFHGWSALSALATEHATPLLQSLDRCTSCYDSAGAHADSDSGLRYATDSGEGASLLDDAGEPESGGPRAPELRRPPTSGSRSPIVGDAAPALVGYPPLCPETVLSLAVGVPPDGPVPSCCSGARARVGPPHRRTPRRARSPAP